MTDAAIGAGVPARSPVRSAAETRLRKRHAAERRFRLLGLAAIVFALAFLAVLLGRIVTQGYSTFWSYRVELPVYVDPNLVDRTALDGVNYDFVVGAAVLKRVGGVDDPAGENVLFAKDLVSNGLGFQLFDRVKANPNLIGQTVTLSGDLSSDAAEYLKGHIERSTPEDQRKLNNLQLGWVDALQQQGVITGGLNTKFLTLSDSTEPELAGVLGAAVGSLLMLAITALIAIPIGVLAAVYLEEFAPKNRWTDLVEVNINNLAAVPSIVYGLLGLALFINTFGAPRSSPLVGGLVLALMALPTVIIATRSSLKAVPPSIREAALALGASRTQAVFHHALPLALPGVMTGSILSLAHALGETAPLLMIGMVAFVPGVPEGFTSAATVLPVQIFIWENASERGFHERTAAAIIVLLAFMILMNLTAILLRRRFERRW